MSDNINVLGIVNGTLGISAVYGRTDNTNGLYLIGKLTGPGFDTGLMNFRIIPW